MKEGKQSRKGISLTWINVGMVAIASLMVSALFVASLVSQRQYHDLQSISDGYVKATKDLHEFDEASDFLTSRAREYVATGHQASLNDYLSFYLSDKQRESSIESIALYFPGGEVYTHAYNALQYSDDLAEVEMYALALAGKGYGLASLPSELSTIELSAEDLALNDTQKVEASREMLFDNHYLELKGKIDNEISQSFTSLISVTTQRNAEATNKLDVVLVFHQITLPVLVAFLIAYGLLAFFLIFAPLKRSEKAIENNLPASVEGAYEVRFVIESYNHMYDLHRAQEKVLLYEVGHDILTGLCNRHDYVARSSSSPNAELYYVIADVDHFKAINDTYGHAAGDRVLSEVARRLRETFLNHDMVYRIGGDEFVVIVEGKKEDLTEKLRQKLTELNHTFAILAAKKQIPEASMSFGVVYKNKEMGFEEAYHRADKALYHVKESGGKGVAFYEELKK